MHGSTTAAWTGVTLALVGFTVGGIALIAGPAWTAFWVGLAMVLLAFPVARVMALTAARRARRA